jgi:hypothetical protein
LASFWRFFVSALIVIDEGAGFELGSPASSSAMMRRMEAKISSMDGSCAFTG